MNLTLRLLITAAWPAEEAACEWALVNEQGVLLQRGCSEPRHWPAAEHCEVVLGAEQSLTLKAQLPKGARSRPAEVIAYALEDQLIGDAEAEHFVVGTEADHGAATPVWVIARARLKSLLAALGALQRTPQRLISELQLAPWPANGAVGHWSLCLRQATGFVRQGAEAGFAFDLAEVRQPPVELRLALQAAGQNPPAGINVYSAHSPAAGFSADIASAWQAELGVPVSLAGEYAWRDTPHQAARNLLTGEFAVPRAANAGWRNFKPALWLGAAALAAYVLFSFGEWLWLDRQAQELRRQMAESFRAAYPQAQSVVDPPLQMQRLNDQLRRSRGQLGSSDFLPLLAAASEILGAQGRLTGLGYEDGRLELTLQMNNHGTAEQFAKTLTGRGMAATLRDAKPSQNGVEAVYAVRGKP